MTVFAAESVWEHPLFVAIAAPLAVALVGLVASTIARSLTTDRDLRRHVLPHFAPPPPGQPDASLPAQVRSVQEVQREQATRLDQLASRVEGHMTDEGDAIARMEIALRRALHPAVGEVEA